MEHITANSQFESSRKLKSASCHTCQLPRLQQPCVIITFIRYFQHILDLADFNSLSLTRSHSLNANYAASGIPFSGRSLKKFCFTNASKLKNENPRNIGTSPAGEQSEAVHITLHTCMYMHAHHNDSVHTLAG